MTIDSNTTIYIILIEQYIYLNHNWENADETINNNKFNNIERFAVLPNVQNQILKLHLLAQ